MKDKVGDRCAMASARLPLDVRVLAGLAILGVLGNVIGVISVWEKGEMVFGLAWTDSKPIILLHHIVRAAYWGGLASGLFRMRAYGFWMLVGLILWGLAGELLWVFWTRHIAPEEVGRMATPFLVISIGVSVALAVWCFCRRGLFIRK